MSAELYGKRVHTTGYLPEWTDGPLYQFRFPRSRGRRIRKKWAARWRNHRPSHVRYVAEIDGVLHMHPRTWYALTGSGEPTVLQGGRRTSHI